MKTKRMKKEDKETFLDNLYMLENELLENNITDNQFDEAITLLKNN